MEKNNLNEQVRKSAAEENNERRIIPGIVSEEGEIGKKIKKGRVKEEGKASQLSTCCLHQGAASLNDKVPIKPRWSLLPAAKRSQR